MKLINLATLTIATLATTTAFAAKNNTEYYFQPANGVSAVELVYKMDIQPRQTQAGAAAAVDNMKTETNDFSLSYAYGLNESNTLGAYIFTGSTKYTTGATSNTASGMGDFHLFYKGSAEIWHYGVDLGVNTAKVKVEGANITNHTSGGPSIKGFVGVMMNSASMNYGADLSYLALLERTIDNNGTDTKVKDGNIVRLAPFAEYNYGMGFLGAELSYAVSADTNSVNVLGTTSTKGESVTALNLYGSFDFSEMATGLLTLGTAMHGSHDETSPTNGNTVKAYTETIASLGVRLNF